MFNGVTTGDAKPANYRTRRPTAARRARFSASPRFDRACGRLKNSRILRYLQSKLPTSHARSLPPLVITATRALISGFQVLFLTTYGLPGRRVRGRMREAIIRASSTDSQVYDTKSPRVIRRLTRTCFEYDHLSRLQRYNSPRTPRIDG